MGKHRSAFKKHPASKSLANRLLRFRAVKNLTQEQFATKANLSDRSLISRAEDGALLRLDTLHKILKVLDGAA